MDNYQKSYLLVDAYNLFIRSYTAYPSMSSSGHQIGGVVGFLKTITNLVKMFSPNIVYIVWESGGSLRRRHLYSDYKRGKRPMRLNRFYGDDIPDTTENKIKQIAILAKMLSYLPVCQIHVQDCEGDDIISYLSKKLQGKKTIVSTDRDYYQLLNEDIIIYNPTKKKIVTENDVLKEFNVSSRNFALAKCICGDSSDNIPGIKGFGYKTVAKKFPILMSKEAVILQDLISYATSRRDDDAQYRKFFDSIEDIKRNWKLVHLDISSLSYAQVKKIDYAVETFAPAMDKMSFIKMLNVEGILTLDIESISYTFTKLNVI